jgi:hypothetical protein
MHPVSLLLFSYIDRRLTGVCCAEAQKSELQSMFDEVLGKALAKGVASSYRSATRSFLQFMLFFGFAPITPVSDVHLAKYVVFACQTMKVSSVKTYINGGIRNFHLINNVEWAVPAQRFLTYRALQGSKRIWGDEHSHKQAITLELLLRIHAVVDWNSLNELTLWAVFLVAFFGLLRNDHLCVKRTAAWNPYESLTRDDFRFHTDCMYVRLRHSKTNQFRGRVHYVPIAWCEGKLSACDAVKKSFARSPAEPLQPAFLWHNKKGKPVPMTHANLIGGLRMLLVRCGVENPAQYAGHSFRRGGATAGFDLGPNFHYYVQLLGDWKSDAFFIYNGLRPECRLALPKALARRAAQLGAQ